MAISIIAIEVQVRPFRHLADSYCSLVSSLATVFILLMCAVLRTGTLVQELKQMPDLVQQSVWEFLDFELTQTLLILFASSLLVFGVVFFFAWQTLRADARLPRVRYRKTDHHAELQKLLPGQRRHAFLSHVWVTGQDQVRVIKSLLKEVGGTR